MLDGVAEGILLGDELVSLVVFDLLFEPGDSGGLGFVRGGDFCQFCLEELDGGGFRLAGLGLEGRFLGSKMVEQAAKALGFFAAWFELVGTDRAGARTFASHPRTLAVEFTLELGLPETELGLKRGVGRGKLGGLCFNHTEALAKRLGARIDGGLEFGLLLGGEAGNGGLGILIFLKDEAGLEGLVPLDPLLGERGFEDTDLLADFFLLSGESGADDLDFRRAVLLDHRGNGVAEKQQHQRVGDGDSHENRDDQAQGKL